jgi:hypothetical protein
MDSETNVPYWENWGWLSNREDNYRKSAGVAKANTGAC